MLAFFLYIYPAVLDACRVLLFGVTSGNRAKRGYAPPEFRETRRLESEPLGYSTAFLKACCLQRVSNLPESSSPQALLYPLKYKLVKPT